MNRDNKTQMLRALIELGIRGHFPFLHPSWIEEATRERNLPLTQQDREKSREILNRLIKHSTSERKMTMLLALKPQERKLFVRAFLTMIENKILDRRPEIH